MRKILGCLLFLAASSALAQSVVLSFPTTAGNFPGATTEDGASQYVDMTGAAKAAIRIEYDSGVTGTVFLECVKDETVDTPSPCGDLAGTSIPFPDHSNLADTYRIENPVGKVRVRFASLAGTDATHKVRATYQAGK